jgi:hypothetical protein
LIDHESPWIPFNYGNPTSILVWLKRDAVVMSKVQTPAPELPLQPSTNNNDASQFWYTFLSQPEKTNKLYEQLTSAGKALEGFTNGDIFYLQHGATKTQHLYRFEGIRFKDGKCQVCASQATSSFPSTSDWFDSALLKNAVKLTNKTVGNINWAGVANYQASPFLKYANSVVHFQLWVDFSVVVLAPQKMVSQPWKACDFLLLKTKLSNLPATSDEQVKKLVKLAQQGVYDKSAAKVKAAPAGQKTYNPPKSVGISKKAAPAPPITYTLTEAPWLTLEQSPFVNEAIKSKAVERLNVSLAALLERYKQHNVCHIERSCADFYLIQGMMLEADGKGHDDYATRLGEAFKATLTELDILLTGYLAMASCGEFRHAGTHAKPYGVCSNALRLSEGGHGRNDVMVKLMTKAKESFNDEFPLRVLWTARECFMDGAWGGSYGGPKWAKIADAVIGRLAKWGPATFVDHCFDLKHNGGLCFDKMSASVHAKGYALSGILNEKFKAESVSAMPYSLQYSNTPIKALYNEGVEYGLWALPVSANEVNNDDEEETLKVEIPSYKTHSGGGGDDGIVFDAPPEFEPATVKRAAVA